jgi:hypothetical protein
MSKSTAVRTTLAFVIVCLAAVPGPAQTRDRAHLRQEIAGLREQLRQREREFLEADPADRAAYAGLLAQPDTGILRLLPREHYDDRGPGKPGEITTRGGGAYFSFTRLTHEYGYGSDIELSNGEFSVGFAGADFGWLTSLGDVPLEAATLDHPAVQYLDSLKTPSAEAEARATHRKTYDGVRHGEHTFLSRVPAAAGSTYGLRSINYDRSDVLVAFRVVRKDADGSVVLLWRLLRTYPVPKLTREREPARAE